MERSKNQGTKVRIQADMTYRKEVGQSTFLQVVPRVEKRKECRRFCMDPAQRATHLENCERASQAGWEFF